MRISDWSSDVCSSDLPSRRRSQQESGRLYRYHGAQEGRGGVARAGAGALAVCKHRSEPPLATDSGRRADFLQQAHGGFPRPGCKIGRATSELQSLMRISYAVFCLKKKKIKKRLKLRIRIWN